MNDLPAGTPTDPNPNPVTPTPASTLTANPAAPNPPAADPANPATPNPTDPANPNPADPNPPAADPNAADPWKDFALDDDLKAFVGTKSPADIAKELKGAQALLGKKSIGIPGKDSTPEEQRAFHTARGVPENEAGYDFAATMEEITKLAPAGFEPDAAREEHFRKLAKSANLSNSEANELMKRELSREFEDNKTQTEAVAEANKKTADIVAEKWGADREAKEIAGNNFARHMGLDDDMMKVFMSAAGTNPQARFNLVNFMAEQGALLEEGGGPGPANLRPGGTMTPEQATTAKQQYLATGDNRDAYMNAAHARHQAVTAQMTEYLKAERGTK